MNYHFANINDYLGFKNLNNYTQVFDIEDSGELVVILCHFNPCAYDSPVRNLKMVLKWLYEQKLPTYAVELRCGKSKNLPPVLPSNHPKVIQLQSDNSIFRKDNLWNVVANKLPKEFKYVLCIDADAILIGDDWQNNLIKKFQTAKIIQPFSKIYWTDSLGNTFKEKLSWGFGFTNKIDLPQITHYFSPGLSIAVERDFWDKTPGMFNSPIGGGSLFLMSAIMGIQNELETSLLNISRPFWNDYLSWSASIHNWAGLKFDCIDATGYHLWHGSRKKRKYDERFERLAGFDPATDIISDGIFGFHEWSTSAQVYKKEMIEKVETYYAIREEDEWFDSTIKRDDQIKTRKQ